MKLNPIMLAMSLALAANCVEAQTDNPTLEESGLKKFLIYPHLQKGFEAMERGNKNRAIAEFEQARTLAPNNAVVASYLAEAYRRFGERGRAEALLTEQLSRNQDNAQLGKALHDLRAQGLQKTTTQPISQPTPQPIQPPNVSPILSINFPKPVNPTKPVARQTTRPIKPPLHAAAPNQAYMFADMAYQTSARGDYISAVIQARKAIQLEPENRAYQKLLVYALVQSGAYEEADALAGQVLVSTSVDDDSELIAQRQLVRQRLAFMHFDASNKALSNNNLESAYLEARKGVAYAPALLAHHLQLIRSLLALGRIEEANQTATESIKNLPNEPALLVIRGYTFLRLGQKELAWADFDKAINSQTLTPTDQQNFRVIAAHAALVTDEPQRALDLLAPLDAADEGISARRNLAKAAMKPSVSPSIASALRLPVPGVICVGSSFTPACDIWPGEESADPGHSVAELAYKAFNAKDYATASNHASEAIKLSPTNRPYRLLRINSLSAAGQLEQADRDATQFLSDHGLEAEILAARSNIRQRLGKPVQATEDANTALQSNKLSLVSEIGLLLQLDRKPVARERFVLAEQSGLLKEQANTNVAYLAALVGDDERALTSFDKAAAQGTLPETALQDAAFAASRLGRNKEAIAYFKKAVDAAESDKLTLQPQALFETRREIADRSRTWGANASLTYRGISSAALPAGQTGAAKDSLQAAVEAYWRPLEYNNGQLLELYGGISATLSSKADYPTGSESAQGTLGVRVKPLAATNLVLALERRLALGSKTTADWLTRVSYSASSGTDLRLDAPSWMTTNVYTEVGRYINQRQTYATFEGQVGRSFRLNSVDPKLVIFPHAVLGADYNSSFNSGSKSAVGAGAGVNVRYWFNEDRYNAPRSYVDVSLQYRVRISGDDRAKGIFLRATLAY